jgi:glycine betaine/proline transport system permease protein
MAIRPVPKIDVLECLPRASEIANLRIVNKDLDFIQRMIQRSDELTMQVADATEYSQLVQVAERARVLVERAGEKAGTLKEFTGDSNPLAKVSNSEELLASVETLSNALTSKMEVLSANYEATSTTAFEHFSSTVDSLQQTLNSSQSYPELLNSFGAIKTLLDDMADQMPLIKAQEGAADLVERVNHLSASFSDKAESVSGDFRESVLSQIDSFNAQVNVLMTKVDQLSTAEQVTTHFEQLKALGDDIGAKGKEFNTFDEVQVLIQNINELGIASHAKVIDLIDGSKIVAKLTSLTNNPEALAHAVNEASHRTEISVVENQLMPLIDNGSQLVDKVQQLSAQFVSSNVAELSERALRMIDTKIGRLEVRFKSEMPYNVNPEGVNFSLSDRIANSAKEVGEQFDSSAAEAMSSDPATMIEFIGAFPERVQNAMETSDIYLLFNQSVSFSSDIMMNSRGCVDSAFRDFTREFGGFIEWMFEPLLVFLDSFEALMLATPWPIFLLIVGALAWAGSRSIMVSVSSMLGIFAIGVFGMWEPMLSTVTLVTAATLMCLAIGIPMGVWMSKSNRAQSVITPILDIMQTIPSFVYLIPVVMLLGIGKVPGLIAVCIYAMPPIVRLTNLGIRLVDKEALEAADAFGASYRQRLFSVQIPLALPNIFAGVNQTIMMALAMVVIASMIGVAGLGLPVLQAVQNQYLSMGMLNGLAIVALAIVFDRVSQAFGTRIQKHRSGDVL